MLKANNSSKTVLRKCSRQQKEGEKFQTIARTCVRLWLSNPPCTHTEGHTSVCLILRVSTSLICALGTLFASPYFPLCTVESPEKQHLRHKQKERTTQEALRRCQKGRRETAPVSYRRQENTSKRKQWSISSNCKQESYEIKFKKCPSLATASPKEIYVTFKYRKMLNLTLKM